MFGLNNPSFVHSFTPYAFVDRSKLDIISNLVRDPLHLERVREMKVAQMRKRYHEVR